MRFRRLELQGFAFEQMQQSDGSAAEGELTAHASSAMQHEEFDTAFRHLVSRWEEAHPRLDSGCSPQCSRAGFYAVSRIRPLDTYRLEADAALVALSNRAQTLWVHKHRQYLTA